MRFIRLLSIQSQFNIIKRFCHNNNIHEQISKNVNVVSKLNEIETNLNVINIKLNDMDTKLKNMDSIMFSIFCLWNGVYFPIIIYLSY
jgi:hypothetical protein